jgi:thioredoxin 1
MSETKVLDDSNFDIEVSNSVGTVLVEFGATWCAPCVRQLPIVEKFAEENMGKVKVCSIDIDDAPTTVAKLGIRGVPTLMLFENGKQIKTKVGLSTLAEVNALLIK